MLRSNSVAVSVALATKMTTTTKERESRKRLLFTTTSSGCLKSDDDDDFPAKFPAGILVFPARFPAKFWATGIPAWR